MNTVCNQSKKTILVIEDEPVIRSLLRTMLAHDYQIQEAVRLNAAFELIHRNKFDAVILDLSLEGGEDGLPFLEHISKAGPNTAVPVIILSGKTDSETIINSLKMGATRYLEKPFSPLELFAILNEVFA